ncbi:hypothetical protein Hanom_Chr02g00172491 [Helianthus anomalus]
MVRTKEKAEANLSSSKGTGKQLEQEPKKRRYLGKDDESESDEEEMMELDPADKPRWEAGPLDDLPEEWQLTLVHDRMNRWEAALSCYDKDNKNLFIDEIQEWMATLKCNKYDRPSQMKLTGEVNGIKVEMSFDTLQKLAKFDSMPAHDYTIPSLDDLLIKPESHPSWNDMLAALFLPNTYSGTLYRKKLKIEAKL